jgi:hypothetical protein
MSRRIVRPTEWTLVIDRPGKRVWRRYDLGTDSVEFMEEWLEDVPLAQAAQERELAVTTKNLKPLAVIPPSVISRAIREGWVNDDKAWTRWMNDRENCNLRVTDGVA